MAWQVVVMGVSGSGKSTVGRALAAALGIPFTDADDLHPPRNVALMAAGTPLTDEDRDGWLAAVAALLASSTSTGALVACSALKRRYRDRLRAAAPGLTLVYLHGSPELLARRLHDRSGHYMPPTLLPSQLATLEPPAADEFPFSADIADAPARIVSQLLLRLTRTG